MTVPEAAQALSISPDTVYALCASGRLGHQRIGLRKGSGHIRISEANIAAYLKSCEVRPEDQAGISKKNSREKHRRPSISGRLDGKPFQHLD